MGTEPRCQSVRVAADLDPVDADGGDAVLDERVARVVGVGDVPLDEERQTLAERGVVGHEVPVELHSVGTCATHRQRLVPGPSHHGVEIVGPQTQRAGPFAGFAEPSPHPRADRAGRRLVTVDDGHQLDVAAAERHDPVAGAVPDVATAEDGRQADRLVVATGSVVEIVDDDDHMVDGQHAPQ